MGDRSYYDKVYEITRSIPFGKVSTYGLIADHLCLGSARMVGWALAQCNREGFRDVPAHRVVNRKGELTGRVHFATPDLMQALLENEGLTIVDHTIVDFKNHRWDPSDS